MGFCFGDRPRTCRCCIQYRALSVVRSLSQTEAAHTYRNTGSSAPFSLYAFFFLLPHLLPRLVPMNATTVAVAPESGMQQLNYIETLWESMYEGRNPLIVTGVFAFLMHEIVYFGRFIPFLICDFIPYFQRYKLQPVSCLYTKFIQEILT